MKKNTCKNGRINDETRANMGSITTWGEAVSQHDKKLNWQIL
jgi:hypothetical protein